MTHLAVGVPLVLMAGPGASATELYRELAGDGPPSLRQLVLDGVLAVGQPPALYWAVGAGLLALLVGLTVVAYVDQLAQARPRDPVLQVVLGARLYAAVLTLVLAAFRWPLLAQAWLDSHESHAIACAMKLGVDPVFWRGIDGGTGGPLLYYPLLIVRLLGQPVEYGWVRLLALALQIGSVLLLYGALRHLFSDGVARLGLLPLATSMALFSEPDFVHYSSEQVPVFLISLAGYLFCRWWRDPSPVSNRGALLTCGAVIGCLPFAKLQAVPVGLFLAICVGARLAWRGRRRAAAARMLGFVASAALVPALVVGLLYLFGADQDFWRSYIVNNLADASRNQAAGESTAAPGVMLPALARRAFWTPELVGLTTAAVWLAVIAAASLALAGRRVLVEHLGLIGFALGFLLASALSVAHVDPMFRHHSLLGLPALAFFAAVGLGLASASLERTLPAWARSLARQLLLTIFIGLAVVYPIGRQLLSGAPAFDEASTAVRVLRSDLGTAMLAFAAPGEGMAVWGGQSWRFAETGLYPAVRDTQTRNQILETPRQPYYLRRFRDDLLASMPPLFVDVVGRGGTPSTQDQPGASGDWLRPHDAFAEIAEVVELHYRPIVEVGQARLYGLRDPISAIEETLGRPLRALDGEALRELAAERARRRVAEDD